jgi:signal transduction histidine kinase
MNIFSFGGVLLGASCIVLSIIISLNAKNKLHRTWLLFNIIVAIWGVGAYLIGRAEDPATALGLWKFAQFGILFISVLFCHTAAIFCELDGKYKNFIRFAYAQATVAFLLILFDVIPCKITYLFNSFYYYQSVGVWYPAIFIVWVSIVLFGLFMLIRTFLNPGYINKKNQLLYFFFGTLVGFVGGITNFFPGIGIQIYPFGNYTIPIYCVIVTYAILRYRLMDIRIAITRIGIFVFVYAFVLGLPFVFAYKTRLMEVSLLLMGALASVGPILYSVFRDKAENILLARQRRYQKILLQAASGMAKEHDLDRLLKLIVYIVKKTVKISFAASFLYDKSNKTFRLRAIRYSLKGGNEIVIQEDNPFIEYLNEKNEPLLYDEIPGYIKKSIIFPIEPALIVPSFYENNPLGFLVLGDKINHTIYTADDINVFKILAQQSALAIENCIFVEEFKKVQERVFNAEKLASIGGMADGVAHQIKNRLNVFSVAAGEQMFEIDDFVRDHAELVEQNPDLKKTFGYLHETAESLVVNVKKTTSIIRGILNFAKVEERETMFSEFALMEIIEQCVNLLLVKHQVANIPVEADIPADSLLYGVKAQIMESVYNLIDNAYEAIREKMEYHLDENAKQGFKPLIKVQLIQKGTTSMIEVADNGMGIKEEHKKKIFAPFFTTKASSKSGSGIGMYVVRRMIEENHGGKIRIESEYGKGTRTVIEIPRKAASADEAGMGKTA